MQDIYRPHGEYQPKRSYGAMIAAALIVGGVGLLGAAAATGMLPIGGDRQATSAAQSKPDLSKAEPPASTPVATDTTSPPEQLASASTSASPPMMAPDPAAKAPSAAAHESTPVAKKPAAKSATAKPTPAPENTDAKVAACSNCGAVESIRMVKSPETQNPPEAPTDSAGQPDNAQAISYRIQIRMEDGSLRTVVQDQTPTVAQGDRVKIVDGMVVHGS